MPADGAPVRGTTDSVGPVGFIPPVSSAGSKTGHISAIPDVVPRNGVSDRLSYWEVQFFIQNTTHADTMTQVADRPQAQVVSTQKTQYVQVVADGKPRHMGIAAD